MTCMDTDKTTSDDSTLDEDVRPRIEVMGDTQRRLIQVRQFTFDLFRRIGVIHDIDLPNICFDDVSFDQCVSRLVERAEHPSVWDEPYVAEIRRFLESVLTDDERKRYWNDEGKHFWEIDSGVEPWVYAPWDNSRLAQARRLVLEIEPRAEAFMDKDIVDCSFSECLCWFRGYLECPNPDAQTKERVNDFLATKVTESDWCRHWYDVNSVPFEVPDPSPSPYVPVPFEHDAELAAEDEAFLRALQGLDNDGNA